MGSEFKIIRLSGLSNVSQEIDLKRYQNCKIPQATWPMLSGEKKIVF